MGAPTLVRKKGMRRKQHVSDTVTTADLPPLVWTSSTGKALTSEADSLSCTATEQRAAVQRRAEHFGADVDTRTDADVVFHLYAGWEAGPDELPQDAVRDLAPVPPRTAHPGRGRQRLDHFPGLIVQFMTLRHERSYRPADRPDTP